MGYRDIGKTNGVVLIRRKLFTWQKKILYFNTFRYRKILRIIFLRYNNFLKKTHTGSSLTRRYSYKHLEVQTEESHRKVYLLANTWRAHPCVIKAYFHVPGLFSPSGQKHCLSVRDKKNILWKISHLYNKNMWKLSFYLSTKLLLSICNFSVAVSREL